MYKKTDQLLNYQHIISVHNQLKTAERAIPNDYQVLRYRTGGNEKSDNNAEDLKILGKYRMQGYSYKELERKVEEPEKIEDKIEEAGDGVGQNEDEQNDGNSEKAEQTEAKVAQNENEERGEEKEP